MGSDRPTSLAPSSATISLTHPSSTLQGGASAATAVHWDDGRFYSPPGSFAQVVATTSTTATGSALPEEASRETQMDNMHGPTTLSRGGEVVMGASPLLQATNSSLGASWSGAEVQGGAPAVGESRSGSLPAPHLVPCSTAVDVTSRSLESSSLFTAAPAHRRAALRLTTHTAAIATSPPDPSTTSATAGSRMNGYNDIFVPRPEFCRRVLWLHPAESGLLFLYYAEDIAGERYQRKTLRYSLCFVFRVDPALMTIGEKMLHRLVQPYSVVLTNVAEELREAELKYAYMSRGLQRDPRLSSTASTAAATITPVGSGDISDVAATSTAFAATTGTTTGISAVQRGGTDEAEGEKMKLEGTQWTLTRRRSNTNVATRTYGAAPVSNVPYLPLIEREGGGCGATIPHVAIDVHGVAIASTPTSNFSPLPLTSGTQTSSEADSGLFRAGQILPSHSATTADGLCGPTVTPPAQQFISRGASGIASGTSGSLVSPFPSSMPPTVSTSTVSRSGAAPHQPSTTSVNAFSSNSERDTMVTPVSSLPTRSQTISAGAGAFQIPSPPAESSGTANSSFSNLAKSLASPSSMFTVSTAATAVAVAEATTTTTTCTAAPSSVPPLPHSVPPTPSNTLNAFITPPTGHRWTPLSQLVADLYRCLHNTSAAKNSDDVTPPLSPGLLATSPIVNTRCSLSSYSSVETPTQDPAPPLHGSLQGRRRGHQGRALNDAADVMMTGPDGAALPHRWTSGGASSSELQASLHPFSTVGESDVMVRGGKASAVVTQELHRHFLLQPNCSASEVPPGSLSVSGSCGKLEANVKEDVSSPLPSVLKRGEVGVLHLSDRLHFHVRRMAPLQPTKQLDVNMVPIPIVAYDASMADCMDMAVHQVFQLANGSRTIADIIFDVALSTTLTLSEVYSQALHHMTVSDAQRRTPQTRGAIGAAAKLNEGGGREEKAGNRPHLPHRLSPQLSPAPVSSTPMLESGSFLPPSPSSTVSSRNGGPTSGLLQYHHQHQYQQHHGSASSLDTRASPQVAPYATVPIDLHPGTSLLPGVRHVLSTSTAAAAVAAAISDGQQASPSFIHALVSPSPPVSPATSTMNTSNEAVGRRLAPSLQEPLAPPQISVELPNTWAATAAVVTEALLHLELCHLLKMYRPFTATTLYSTTRAFQNIQCDRTHPARLILARYVLGVAWAEKQQRASARRLKGSSALNRPLASTLSHDRPSRRHHRDCTAAKAISDPTAPRDQYDSATSSPVNGGSWMPNTNVQPSKQLHPLQGCTAQTTAASPTGISMPYSEVASSSLRNSSLISSSLHHTISVSGAGRLRLTLTGTPPASLPRHVGTATESGAERRHEQLFSSATTNPPEAPSLRLSNKGSTVSSESGSSSSQSSSRSCSSSSSATSASRDTRNNRSCSGTVMPDEATELRVVSDGMAAGPQQKENSGCQASPEPPSLVVTDADGQRMVLMAPRDDAKRSAHMPRNGDADLIFSATDTREAVALQCRTSAPSRRKAKGPALELFLPTESELAHACSAVLCAVAKFSSSSVASVQGEMRSMSMWSCMFNRWSDRCLRALVEVGVLNGWIEEVHPELQRSRWGL